MDKRLLYITSSRDADTHLTSEEYRDKCQFGNGHMLYQLEQIGWSVRRLSFWESWSPWTLAPHIDDFQPTVIFTNGTTALSPVWARRWFCRWSGPIVLGWDDYYDHIWRTNFGSLAGIAMHHYERWIVRDSDYVITLTKYNEERAREMGKTTWYLLNGCVEPVYDDNACRIRLSGEMKLVYCGDQGEYKRTRDIVDAMAHVSKDIRLYLIGRPNPRLQRRAPENAIFLGYLSHNDKWAVMSQADVLVNTADMDSNSKVYEYLRMKKPILGYDGIPNYKFTNRVNALLTRDYPAAIMELYRSPELREELAKNAERDLPVCTWFELAQQYDSTFREILSLYWSEDRGMSCSGEGDRTRS